MICVSVSKMATNWLTDPYWVALLRSGNARSLLVLEWCLVLTQKPGLFNLPCYRPKQSVISAFQQHSTIIYSWNTEISRVNFLWTRRNVEKFTFRYKSFMKKLVSRWTLPLADSSLEGLRMCQVSVTEKTFAPCWSHMSRIQGRGLICLLLHFLVLRPQGRQDL